MAPIPLLFICTVFTLLTVSTASGDVPIDSDCQDGWSSCDSSLWVTSSYNSGDPLSPYAPGDVRGPLEYEVKFSCRGRRNGYYADLDHSCKVWHYCNTTREVDQYKRIYSWTYMHYSYVCPEAGTRYDQVLRECVPESKAIVRCHESELYYPKEDYVSDVPIVVSSNNRLVPVRCPTTPSEVKCHIQNDHIKLKGCPESPGVVSKFYSSIPDVDASSYFGVNEVVTTLAPPPSAPAAPPRTPSSYAANDEASDVDDSDSAVSADDDEVHKAPVESSSTSQAPPPAPAASTAAPVEPSEPSAGGDEDTDEVSDDSADARPVPTLVSSTVAPVSVRPSTSPSVTARPPIVPRGPSLIPVNSFARPKPFRFRDTPEVAARKTIAQQHSNPSSGRKHLSPAHSNRIRHESHPSHDEHHDDDRVVFPPRVSHTVAPAVENVTDEVALPVAPALSPIIPHKLDTSFNCNGRVYGYYADIANECKIYHVCAPKLTNGVQSYEHYSFICANGLVFDQQRITCVPQDDVSVDCANSESYYANRLHSQPVVHQPVVYQPVVHQPVVHHQAVPHRQAIAAPARSKVASRSRKTSVVKSPVNRARTVTILTVRSTGKYDGANAKVAPSAVARFPHSPQAAERGRRGDQSPAADEDDQVHSPVHQSPAVHHQPSRAVNHATKALKVNQVTHDASVKTKLQSPGARRYAYLRESPVPQTPRKVVYRLKKNSQVPITYTQRNPHIERYPQKSPSVVHSAAKSSQLVQSPRARVASHPQKTLSYSSQVSHVTHGNNHASVQYIPPIVSPSRTVNGHHTRSHTYSNALRSYGSSSSPHISPARYRTAPVSSPLASSRLEDAESSLYW